MSFTVPKIRKLRGSWKALGDKSISHRALLLACLANGKSVIENFLRSEDCFATARALKMMGVEIIEEKNHLAVLGKGLYGLKKPTHVLDVGNSATTLRLLTGILSAQKFSSVITGDHSLVSRPMKELIYLLRQMGAHLEGHDQDSTAPVNIYPASKSLEALFCEPTVPSAQIKSALLLAGLYANGTTAIKESISTRDHTERLLKSFGVSIESKERGIRLIPSSFDGKKMMIPGDISSSAFLITAALLLPQSELEIEYVGLNPTRTGFLDVIQSMGAQVEIQVESEEDEPWGRIFVKSSELQAVTVEGLLTIRTLDELPLVALLATQAEGVSRIRHANSLRYKESNRLDAITSELTKMGAMISQIEDGWVIQGATPLRGASLKSYQDHRIAMTLVIAGLLAGRLAESSIEIDSVDSIQKSFPSFLSVLEDLSS